MKRRMEEIRKVARERMKGICRVCPVILAAMVLAGTAKANAEDRTILGS